jgi:hypothetical protein
LNHTDYGGECFVEQKGIDLASDGVIPFPRSRKIRIE